MPVTPNSAAAEELNDSPATEQEQPTVEDRPTTVVAEEALVEEVSIDGMCGVY